MYEKSYIIFGTSYCPETYRDSYQIPLGFVQVFADSNLSCKQFCLLHAFCHLQIFFKINIFKKFFQEYNQIVKKFGSSSGSMFWWA